MRSIHALARAVTDHDSRGTQQAFEGCELPLRAILLEETECDAQHDNPHDEERGEAAPLLTGEEAHGER